MIRGFASLLIALTASCAPVAAPTPIPRMEFPDAEYAALPQSGTATVTGQAFLKTRGGDVKTAAGNEVVLNPVTSYSLQWYESAYLPGKPIAKYDPRLEKYFRKTIADAEGRFTFRGVPAGEYFVTTKVTWEAPTGYGGALVTQGGFVTKRITVKDGDQVEVIVTR